MQQSLFCYYCFQTELLSSKMETLTNMGKLSPFLFFIDFCSSLMLAVSVRACKPQGSIFTTDHECSPRLALYRAHFPKTKLKPVRGKIWNVFPFGSGYQMETSYPSARMLKLTDGDWKERGCKQEAHSQKIQDKAYNQMSQHDQSRSQLQNKTVWGLCQSSKRLWLQMASLNSPDHSSIFFMAGY